MAHSNDNIGGFSSVEILFIHQIETTHRFKNKIIVSIKNNAQWKILPCTPETIQCNTTEEQTDNGIIYKHNVSIYIPGFIPIMDINDKKVVARITDNNGKKIIVGTHTTPLLAHVQTNFAQTATEYNGKNITLTANSIHPALGEYQF